MTPRQLAPEKPAKAPPKSDFKGRTFGRFKEKRFLQAIELVKNLQKEEYGGFKAIVGSEKLKRRLEKEGIDAVCNNQDINENEIILNRARDSGESNFFVFIKFNAFKTTVFFTDPSSGHGGRALSRRELMRSRTKRFWNRKKDWIENVANEVRRVQERKGRDKFFVVAHGHWGQNKEEGIYRDDGVSKRRDIIRRMMLWNYDVDATGYHNWIHLSALRDITHSEERVGILKVPSLEFTLPYEYGVENGPHLNLWFANEKVALLFWEKFLKNDKQNLMPGLAANIRPDKVLEWIDDMRQKNLMALGVAHPSCVMKVVVSKLAVGLLDLLADKDENGEPKYSWSEIMEFMHEYVDGVGLYNSTVGGYKLEFDDPKVQEYLWSKIQKRVSEEIGGDAEMYGNVVNYAFAKAMEGRFGTFVYADPDAHVYLPTDRYERLIGPLAHGRTVIKAGEDAFEAIKRQGGLRDRDVVRIMRDRKYLERLQEGGVKEHTMGLGAETFLALKDGNLKPVGVRDDLLYKVRIMKMKIKQGFLNVVLAVQDARHRISKMHTKKT